MTCDIIATVAWSCDETDGCTSPGGWHMSNYWLDDEVETGYTVDRYADGDHEDVDEEDLPEPDHVIETWREYGAWVAANGQDPLHNYWTPKDVTTQERRYTVTLTPSILGPIIVGLRRNHRAIGLDEIGRIPALRQYLEAESHGGRWIVMSDPPTRLEEIASFNHLTIRNRRLVLPFSIEITRPDAAARERRWLISKAKEKAA